MIRCLSIAAALLTSALVLPGTAHAKAIPAESYTSAIPIPPASVTVTTTRWPSTYGSLSGIAAAVCRDASRWPGIARDNHVTNPRLLQIGVRLTVRCTRVVVSRSTMRVRGGWVSPLPGAPCVSGWGAPRVGHTHKGIDLSRGSGTPIHAAHAGTVMRIRYQDGGAGWYLMLNHGTYQTVYMHMRSRSVLTIGARVQAGATIGYVGDTGDPKPGAYHLHFEVHHDASHPINPAPFLRARGVRVGC